MKFVVDGLSKALHKILELTKKLMHLNSKLLKVHYKFLQNPFFKEWSNLTVKEIKLTAMEVN